MERHAETAGGERAQSILAAQEALSPFALQIHSLDPLGSHDNALLSQQSGALDVEVKHVVHHAAPLIRDEGGS